MTPETFYRQWFGAGKEDKLSEESGVLIECMTEYTKEKDTRIADLEAKLAQAIEFQKRAFSYAKNGCSWEEFFTAQEKEAQESEKGGL